ncbi:MAG: VacJ family lipoprotein [Sulfuricurvum sp.]
MFRFLVPILILFSSLLADDLDDFTSEFETKEIFDPLSGYNRFMSDINDHIYVYALRPVARGYKMALPKRIRTGVANVFHNLLFPIRLANNLLQGKLKNSLEESERFLLNSTVGFLGFWDVAEYRFGIKPHNEDFGQTLGHYGVGSGFHIVLPILGPSNLRDAISLYPDSLLSVINYDDHNRYTLTDSWGEYITARGVDGVNELSFRSDDIDKIRKSAVDLYPYIRDIYEQHRDSLIKE